LSEEDRAVVLSTGSLQSTEFAKSNPEVAAAYKIAGEITPEWHVKVQAHWQKWIDSSISKTVNLPKEATVEEIKHTYRVAHKLGLKGITVYRSGTLESEPIKVGAKEEEVEVEEPTNGCRSGSCEIH
jgi:ribonucleoside-diphosphate reductase alpha chain